MKWTNIVKSVDKDQRFDKFLTANFADFSRTYLQKQIRSGAVLVNGKMKKPGYILKEADRIDAEILAPSKISLEPNPSVKLNIVYEDTDVIVIDKPAGLTTHPSDIQKNNTLVNGLLAHYPLLADVGDDPARPGIAHRLDKDTSGLMIVAKNINAFAWLKKQFQERKVIKKYLVLVVGAPKEPEGTIKTYLARSQSDPTKQKVSLASTDREAITKYRVVKKFNDFALVEAQPKTGRMHQIRVHLAWLGHPVAGDKKYGSRKNIAPSELKRQFLHATELSIILPNGQKRTFASPLPPDLKDILKALK